MTEITETVFRQYREVQESGEVNMVDKTGVKRVAHSRQLDELVGFIETGDYYEILNSYDELREKFGVEA